MNCSEAMRIAIVAMANTAACRRLVGYLPARLRRLIVMAGYAAENVAIAEFTGYEGLMSHTTSFIDKFSRIELRERCTECV